MNPVQQQILLMTGLGFTVRRIAEELNRDPSTIVGCRRTISKRLLAFANEERLERLKVRLEHVKGGRRKKLTEEYQRRYAVRQALKNLSALMSPIEPPPYSHHFSTTPALLFERLVKSGGECKLRQYLDNSFHDELTICPICRQCSK